jgi:hypothetical protein
VKRFETPAGGIPLTARLHFRRTMLEFRVLSGNQIPWDELDRFADRTVFQTREWLEYIAETQNGTPVVAELRDGGALAGYFSGVLIRKLGLRILGSPFPGWTTPYMGFNLLSNTISRAQAVEALRRWAFGTLGCFHLEVSDWQFRDEGTSAGGLEQEPSGTYESDLTQTEEELLRGMSDSCRWSIRKAKKLGVSVEEAAEDGFADEYYAQLIDVFAKQGLRPTYSVERVRALVRRVYPTGHLLLLRARDSQGRSIATGLFPGFNKWALDLGTASWRSEQRLRPNEALHWYAMQYWKRQGVRHFDWGGAGGGAYYKEKYGGAPTCTPWFYGSKYRIIAVARKEALDLYHQSRRLIKRLRGVARQPAAASAEQGG